MDYVPQPDPQKPAPSDQQSEAITQMLEEYKDVFNDPQQLPPQRSYDCAIPLIPGSQFLLTLGHTTTLLIIRLK